MASLSPCLAFFSSGDDALLERVEIGQHQFGLDRLDVGDRIDLAFDMRDVAILEAAHHMGDGIDLADVGEELVAEALALRSAAHEAGDVDEGQARRNDLLRAGDLRQHVKARIGHAHVADIGLDGAERIVRRLRRRRLRQRIEERGLADIGKSDDATLETHQLSAFFAGFSGGGLTARWTLFWNDPSSPLTRRIDIVGDGLEQRFEPCLVGLGEIAQHMRLHQIPVTRMTDAQPHTHEMRPAMGDHRADAVMACRTAAELHPHLAGFEVELVIEHDDLRRDRC